MFVRKTLSAVILGASLLVPTLASAAPEASGENCVLLGHKVTSVTAYRVWERAGRGATTRLAGARIDVRAEPGLTAEWLQLTIEQHLAKMRGGMANCPLDMKEVRVSVDSAGAGFAVKIVAKNATQAKEVLERAQLLLK